MNNQNPNDVTTLTAGPKEEEILEQNLQRFREDTRKYITEELNQAGWTLVPQNADGTPMNPGMNLASQADAMAYIIADKLVREGRGLLIHLRDDYYKKTKDVCQMKIESLEASYKDKYGDFLRKVEFDMGSSIVRVTKKHDFEEKHEVKTMLEDLKEMKPFLKAGEGKTYLEALKTGNRNETSTR